jgi:hypothetical protein
MKNFVHVTYVCWIRRGGQDVQTEKRRTFSSREAYERWLRGVEVEIVSVREAVDRLPKESP